jgi:opacity protein-like surface antigen
MSRQQRIPFIALALGALILGLQAHAAHAQESKRVVVVPFSGSGGGKIASTTAEILQAAGYTVVSDDDYREAARKLDAKGQDDANVARVASELQLSAVIFGEVDKEGGGRKVTLAVHAGANGAQVAKVEFEVKRRKLTPEEEETVRTKLLPALSGVTGAPPPPPPRKPAAGKPADGQGEEAIEMEGEGGEGAEAGGEETPAPTGPAVAQADDTEELEFKEPARGGAVVRRDSDDDEEDKPEAKPIRAGFELTAGVSFSARNLSPDARAGIDGPTYEGPLAPALALGLEVYPASFASESLPARFILANIGIQAHFDRVFALTSEIVYRQGGDDMTETVDTTQMRFGGGLVYRLYLGDSATAPVLKLGVGYEQFQFTIDRGALPSGVTVPLPDVQYASLDPGLSFRFPVTPALALTAVGRLFVLLDAGDVAKADQYGDTSSSLGYEAGLDVEYMISERLGVRAGARYMNFTLGFEGNGTLSNELDNDASTQDVDGISDTYLGGLVTVGYLF